MLGVYTGAGTTLGSPFTIGDVPDTPCRCSRSRTAFTQASSSALRGILQRAVLTLRAEGVLIGVGVAAIVTRATAWSCAFSSIQMRESNVQSKQWNLKWEYVPTSS